MTIHLSDLSNKQTAALTRLSGAGEKGNGEHRSLGWVETISLNDLVVLALAEIQFDVSGGRWYRLTDEGRAVLAASQESKIDRALGNRRQ